MDRIWENRAEIWITAAHAGAQKMVIGNGFGQIHDSLLESADVLRNTIRYQTVDSAHNIFLDWWVQGGIGALLPLLFLTCTALVFYFKNNRKAEFISLLGLIFTLSCNPASTASLVAYFWLLGQSTITITTKNDPT